MATPAKELARREIKHLRGKVRVRLVVLFGSHARKVVYKNGKFLLYEERQVHERREPEV